MRYLKVIFLPVLFLLASQCLLDLSFPQVKRYVLKQDYAEDVKRLGILIALSKEGVVERPAKSNRGKDINEFLMSVSLKPGNEWCVAFCQWAYRNAARLLDVNFNMIKTGHSLTAFSYAKKHGLEVIGQIKKGDWIIFQRGNTQPGERNLKGHCGIVLSYDGNIIATIEGNVLNPTGDNQGVYKKLRKLNHFGWLHIVGFIGFE